MNKIDQKRENEKRILKVMIDIYQRKHPQERCVKIFICMLVCVLINVLLWKLKLFVVDVKFIAIKKNIEAKLKK